jgi:cellobiose-specific phosphotransferase system component IIC
MERIFQILAVILAGVAAYFLWNGNSENAFVAGVFGAASFFLSLRFQVKERLRENEAAEQKRREVKNLESENTLGETSVAEQLNGQRTTDNDQTTNNL